MNPTSLFLLAALGPAVLRPISAPVATWFPATLEPPTLEPLALGRTARRSVDEREAPHQLASGALDEERFLLLALRELLARWPAQLDACAIAQHRRALQSFASQAEQAPAIAKLFQRLLLASSELEHQLVAQGLLREGALQAQAAPEWLFDQRVLERSSGQEPLTRSKLSAARAQLTQRGGEVDAAWSKLEQDLSELWLRAAQLAGELALRAGRPASESGYQQRLDDSLEDAKRHSNDPFALLAFADQASRAPEDGLETLLSALVYGRAATLVPARHGDLRRRLFECASSLGALALNRMWLEQDLGYPVDAAELVVQLLERQLSVEESALGRYRLALARNMQEQPRAAFEEIQRAQALFASRPDVVYDAACIAARAGEVERALVWLEASCQAGCDRIAWARRDPELENLRRARGEDFERITGLRWSWYLTSEDGSSALVLRTESCFALTHVSLQLHGERDSRSLLLRDLERLPAGMQASWTLPARPPSDELIATLTAHEVTNL